MSISDREKLVLNAIINYYLTYGDTIGSRTLVKKYGIDLSSATIRNVMADLEDLGYIEKTHTSSGRIPTDKGYKYYLSELLKVEKITQEEKENIELAYEQRINELDLLLKKTSTLLSKLTTYAGIVVETSTFADKIKRVELVYIDSYTIFAVIVMESNNIKSKKISLSTPTDRKELEKVVNDLNNKLTSCNLSVFDIERFILGSQYDNIINGNESDFLNDSVAEESKFFVHNMPGIFKDKNVSEVSEVMELFSNRNNVTQIFEEIVKNKNIANGSVDVLFGDELGIKGLEDFSFVYSVYKIGNSQGILGVIGPKRMPYSKTMGLIKQVTKEVNKVITNIEKKFDKT
ncbi:MAG: heat-inducible transcriptional repressor HrcA [Fusobacteriaceae bacterium]|jgi:heat-inducible transcriptional repressor|nr:heat-inducible transcriptional repressor HrcA [Fusobacteriaceae bacterium]